MLLRAFWAALPAYYVWHWTERYGEELKWTKTYYAFQKVQINMGEHDHVLI